MATTKMTTIKALDYILDTYGDMDDFPVEVKDKLLHMKEQAIKKNTTPRKPNAKQVENDEVRAEILEFLRDSKEPKRISEICAGIPALNDATSQRVSGLLRTLYVNGMVDKFVNKRITYFAVTEGV